MSASPSDILESDAYNHNNTIAHCHECGCEIDVESDYNAISLNGERFCCWDCCKEVAIITSIRGDYNGKELFFAYAEHDHEEVQSGKYSTKKEAVKRAAELAELAWGVESYIERG